MENLSEFEHLFMIALPYSPLKPSLVSVDLSSPKTAVAILRSNVSGRTLKDTSASWCFEDSSLERRFKYGFKPCITVIYQIVQQFK